MVLNTCVAIKSSTASILATPVEKPSEATVMPAVANANFALPYSLNARSVPEMNPAVKLSPAPFVSTRGTSYAGR